MTTRRFITTLLIIVLTLSGTTRTLASPRDDQKDNDTTEGQESEEHQAQVVWEQAIAAKGGRKRLYAVRNMVISSRWEYRSSSFKMIPVRQEEVFVFPNKYWFWNDLRPDVFGLSVEMYNYETGMYYHLTPGNPHSPPVPIIDTRSPNISLMNAQLFYLLETKWLKPTLVKASKGRIGTRAVDIVQTTVNNERIDFAFDQKTHLPIRISEYGNGTTRTSLVVQYLSDYIESGGIKMPQMLRGDANDHAYKESIQINVEYNEDIFNNPPSMETE
ncbi:MAG: hypothetical protein ABR563_18335, partial [Pyrinomonadaceae bacterium]